MTSRLFEVGDYGRRIRIDDTWRVLDVGSGQSPHVRADVLLERYPDDARHRAGDPIDTADPRLIVGDACAMPFGNKEFDYIIASHLAEHVDDPAALCRELSRVGKRGYVETPGWLGDLLLREDFHIWRVRRRGSSLEFTRVRDKRPLGRLGDAIYGLVYAGVLREGHRTPQSSSRAGRFLLRLASRLAGRAIRTWPLRPLIYLDLEWEGQVAATVRG